MKRLLTVLLLLPVVAACGPKTKPVLIKTDQAIYLAVKALHEGAVNLGNAGVITPAQELRIQEAILPVTILGEQASRILAEWKSGPTPDEVTRLVERMGVLVQEIIKILPNNDDARATLLQLTSVVQQAILSAIVIAKGGV